MSKERAYEQHYTQLKLIVEKIVSHIPDFEALLAIVSAHLIHTLFIQTNVIKTGQLFTTNRPIQTRNNESGGVQKNFKCMQQ